MDVEPDISTFRPDRPGIRKVLGDLEAEIMELIWARPPDQGTTVLISSKSSMTDDDSLIQVL
jgi:hypothetical protein